MSGDVWPIHAGGGRVVAAITMIDAVRGLALALLASSPSDSTACCTYANGHGDNTVCTYENSVYT